MGKIRVLLSPMFQGIRQLESIRVFRASCLQQFVGNLCILLIHKVF